MSRHERPELNWGHLFGWETCTEAWDHDHESRYPKFVWDTCWEKYNTIQIPIVGGHEFFEIALNIARMAKGKEDFERIFEEKIKQRQVRIKKLLSDAWVSGRDEAHLFPCKDSALRVRRFVSEGSYIDSVRLLKGVAFGWGPDEEPNRMVHHPDLHTDELSIPFTDKWNPGIFSSVSVPISPGSLFSVHQYSGPWGPEDGPMITPRMRYGDDPMPTTHMRPNLEDESTGSTPGSTQGENKSEKKRLVPSYSLNQQSKS